MFITKGYKNNDYLFFVNPATGKRTKLTVKTVEKILSNYLASKPAEALTLSKLEAEVMQYINSNHSKSSATIYKYTFQKFIEVIGNLPITGITVNEIEKFKEIRSKQVRKTSVNVELRVIKAILNIAVKREYLTKRPEIKLFKIPQAEPVAFSSWEIEMLLPTLPNYLRNIVEFTLLTGCRLNEVINLQFSDLNLGNMVLTIRNKADFKTKSGRIREIPISPKLLELIKRLMDGKGNIYSLSGNLLFSNNGYKFNKDYISKQFKKHLRALNMPEKFHFHCLRHSFVTNLVKAGVNFNHIKQLAGHQDLETTMNYVHLNTNDLRDAVTKI